MSLFKLKFLYYSNHDYSTVINLHFSRKDNIAYIDYP